MAKERINEVNEVAGQIRSFLEVRKIKVDKIVLFGSYIKGNYKKDSDIDIAIISRDFDGKDIFQKVVMLKGLKWYLVEKFSFPFDIIPVSLKEWQGSSSLMVDFIKEGEVLPL